MAAKLLCLFLLLLSLKQKMAIGSKVGQQSCVQNASSCQECIQANPQCAWCLDHDAAFPCHTVEGLLSTGCQKDNIYSPQGVVEYRRNEQSGDSAETMFLHPQEVSLQLRPGVSQRFSLNVHVPSGQATRDLIVDVTSLPDGVNITLTSTKTKPNHQLVEVTVEATKCPSGSNSHQNESGPWSVLLTPRGFLMSVQLQIILLCKCSCNDNLGESSIYCLNGGSLVCGQCKCQHPYFGTRCQLTEESLLSEEGSRCRSGPDAQVCSDNGLCIDGQCECFKRKNPDERHTGRFCECKNFDCPYHNNRICGGHGTCSCGKCICDYDWVGEACNCSTEYASCLDTNQNICGGRGGCVCGVCECEPPFAGPTCGESF